MTLHRVRRSGFSLIELLIVVAIIAALVGVAVPMFQKNIAEANRAKARQDLDTVRNAITLHDSQNKPLIGTSLKPLLGRYLQDVPKDPWGNDYLLDAGIGIVVSFGGDQKAGGTEEDADEVVRYKPALKVQSVTLQGNWGKPTDGNVLRILFNKPFKATGDPRGDLFVITDAKNYGTGISLAGSGSTTGMSWGGATWTYRDTESDPNNGVMIMKCTASATGDGVVLTPSCAMNIGGVGTSTLTSSTSISEQYTAGGPLDP
ncbi:MAG: type II secretion system protein GspG, partial [Candidatus Riflebacteria bacterium]|nr:type II secretion system protein GspG [Candidatus Riflebacteria bacterium]